jgi:hypothetical protein
VVTNHAPYDHRWHHGLWWSWKFINDILYWEDHPGYGGNRKGLGRSQVERHAVDADRERGLRIAEGLTWRENDRDRTVMSEERTMLLAPFVPGLEDAWSIDWDLRWTAEADLTFDTTPYPEVIWGGYAGLNYRPARSLASQETILGEGGRSDAKQLHGERSSWMAYSGCLDGAETDEPNDPAIGGLAIFEHPSNRGFPNCAYTQAAAAGFGFLGTAPLMRAGFRLERGEKLRLRYRTVVLGRAADAAVLDSAYAGYREASANI